MIVVQKKEVASVVDTTGGQVEGLRENEGIIAKVGCKSLQSTSGTQKAGRREMRL